MTTAEPGGPDYFTFLTFTWDVTAAAELAADLPVRTFAVQSALQLLPFIRVDKEHAATVDLAEPVLLAYIEELDSALVIDGWHRVHRAWDEGVRELPGKLLTADQERQARVAGAFHGERAARRAALLEGRS